MDTKREVRVKRRYEISVIEIQDYILQNSVKNALKFVEDLRTKMEHIIVHPKAYPPKKMLLTQRKLYRFAIYKKSYKIIFKVLDKKLVFIDIIHTKQNPDKIKELRTTDYD